MPRPIISPYVEHPDFFFIAAPFVGPEWGKQKETLWPVYADGTKKDGRETFDAEYVLSVSSETVDVNPSASIEALRHFITEIHPPIPESFSSVEEATRILRRVSSMYLLHHAINLARMEQARQFGAALNSLYPDVGNEGECFEQGYRIASRSVRAWRESMKEISRQIHGGLEVESERKSSAAKRALEAGAFISIVMDGMNISRAPFSSAPLSPVYGYHHAAMSMHGLSPNADTLCIGMFCL